MSNDFDPKLKEQNARRKAQRKRDQHIVDGRQRYAEWLKRNPGKKVTVIRPPSSF